MALQFGLKKFSTAAMAAVVGGSAGVGLSYKVAHAEQGKEAPEAEKTSNPFPRTSAAGFDPEALERGAKVLREINSSKYAKQVRRTLALLILEWWQKLWRIMSFLAAPSICDGPL